MVGFRDMTAHDFNISNNNYVVQTGDESLIDSIITTIY